MTTLDAEVASWRYPIEPTSEAPRLSVISGEGQSQPESRDLFENYFGLRIAAGFAEKPEGEELKQVQEDVRNWLVDKYVDLDRPGSVADYRTYDINMVTEKIGGLVDFLKERHAEKVSDMECEASGAFIEATFAMYADKDNKEKVADDRDGSYAFVVPARMSRKNPLYGQEVEPVIPALRYVPNELRAWMMRECPPFIIDTYKPDEEGRRGYLVYAPVTEDMKTDLAAESAAGFINAARDAVNDAVDFAHNRLGVRVVGLGATLPSVTKYGESVRQKFSDEDLIVTTGHGGTAVLICKTIDALTDHRPKRIGILGLGAIGASAAEIAADTYEGQITIFDTVASKITKLDSQRPGRFTAAEGIAELFHNSDVIVSAVTSPIDFDKAGIDDLHGKLIVDDSQPASCHPEDVNSRGGTVAWVIGKDTQGHIRRTGYDYGTMADARADLFGCEAEAATLERYWHDLEAEGVAPSTAARIVGHLAITGPVTVQSAGLIGQLFDQYEIGTAEPQAFGQLI